MHGRERESIVYLVLASCIIRFITLATRTCEAQRQYTRSLIAIHIFVQFIISYMQMMDTMYIILPSKKIYILKLLFFGLRQYILSLFVCVLFAIWFNFEKEIQNSI